LSPNGKVDRGALPAPVGGLGSGHDYVAPRTDVERVLCDIWAQLLKVDRVGIEDNFFELGGDSILSIQVVSRARQAGLRLTSNDIFAHQTVASLAGQVAVLVPEVTEHQPVVLAGLDQFGVDRLVGDGRLVEDIYPLTSMQAGIVFHALSQADQGLYVEQLALVLEGVPHPELLAAAWQHVVDRTPILRTGIVWDGLDQPLQVVHRQVKLPVAHHDWRGLAAQDRDDQLQQLLSAERTRGFELSAAPLLRVHLARVSDTAVQLVWTFH